MTTAQEDVLEKCREEDQETFRKSQVTAKEKKGWHGVDLDGTPAMYSGWQGVEHIGDPVPLMIERVKQMLANGLTVKIMTARAFRLMAPLGSAEHREGILAVRHIESWCLKHGLPLLEVTCVKDFGMITLYDDRCVQIIPNTGLRADGQP